MRAYRHHNGRTQLRTGGGQFRQTTLGDIGMAVCGCGAIFAPDLSKCYVGGFIDPRAVRKAQEKCPACRGQQTDGSELRIKKDPPSEHAGR